MCGYVHLPTQYSHWALISSKKSERIIRECFTSEEDLVYLRKWEAPDILAGGRDKERVLTAQGPTNCMWVGLLSGAVGRVSIGQELQEGKVMKCQGGHLGPSWVVGKQTDDSRLLWSIWSKLWEVFEQGLWQDVFMTFKGAPCAKWAEWGQSIQVWVVIEKRVWWKKTLGSTSA